MIEIKSKKRGDVLLSIDADSLMQDWPLALVLMIKMKMEW